MEEDRTIEGLDLLPPPTSFTVAVAVNGNKKSKYVVQWALDKFVREENIFFKLLHIRPKITTIPTPMGNCIPLSQVRDEVVAAYMKEVEWKTREKLRPYEKMCINRKVKVETKQLESDNIADAIAGEIDEYDIRRLVIGVSSCSIFSRGQSLSSRISECTPNFCTVYAVSKGKLSSLRPSDSVTIRGIQDDSSETSSSTNNASTCSFSSQTEWTEQGSAASYSHFHSPSLPMQRFQALSAINHALLHRKTNSTEIQHSRIPSMDISEEEDAFSSCSNNSDTSHVNGKASSFRSFATDHLPSGSDQTSALNAPSHVSSQSQDKIDFELEKLRIELRHIRGIYAIAQSEKIDASRKLKDLHKHRVEEATKLKELSLKEEEAKELAKQEQEKYKASKKEAEYVKACNEKEAAQRRDAEAKALHEAKEKKKLENLLTGTVKQYQNFMWEEIVSATSSFSENLKIGRGAYGTVYKCSLHHTTAAVKVLHSNEAPRMKQFQQELDILSRIRHPHLLSLLGACLDHGCLVYEYMEHGSLEDRLVMKNNTPPIPWFERYRIACEVASTLVFLHNSKPEPIIHRDLKPANILLDHNFVSKIGDVGLSTMIHSDDSLVSATYKDTSPVGSFCYIDPEYQRTGIISPKSDVYAFGMVILQLLTAKPAIALIHVVEAAIDNDRLKDILDTDAGVWPIEETKELAMLGLKCAELRRKDRPDLKTQVLPILEKLKVAAEKARYLAFAASPPPPNHFLCPVLKDVMNDPCVAADGYTYDKRAIETWLEKNDNSPMTNLPLPNKNLIPNYTLLSAIMEWKSRK